MVELPLRHPQLFKAIGVKVFGIVFVFHFYQLVSIYSLPEVYYCMDHLVLARHLLLGKMYRNDVRNVVYNGTSLLRTLRIKDTQYLTSL